VDPALTGKVKITVIATGFGPGGYVRSLSSAQTPIDMSQYADVSRRVEVASAQAAERITQAKIAVGGRRGIVDLPSINITSAQTGPNFDDIDRDLESNSALDVPAFLRRQEG